MPRFLSSSLLALALVAPFELGRSQGPVVVLKPAAATVVVTKDIEYGRADSVILRMDVYRPAAARGRVSPTLIFWNRATGADRSNSFYASWARAAASRGLVAVLPDLRNGNEPADFQSLMAHLTARGASVGVDHDAIAVYAASGNVSSALPTLEDPKQKGVKAAVIYYGTAQVSDFRLDLPVLYVRAGLDRPGVNQDIMDLASRAIAQNAPLTLVNHASGYHAFEMFNDDDVTRDVMDQTIAFVTRTTSRQFQAAIRRGIPEATAAGFMQTHQYAKAASVYATLVASRVDDARLRMSYGEALLGAERYADACSEFEKLKGKGLGPRDLGLPAARACMQKGDPAAAIAWLRSIPTRFLPPNVADDPVFAAIKDREEFRALFEGR